MKTNSYPKSPELQNYDLIKPSKQFKKVAVSVMLSVFLFFLFYLILIAIAAVVMVAAGWAGITLIAAKPNFITFTAGGGIIALGVMFFIFLFKFLFSRTKHENPMRMELKKEDYPELFNFIKSLTADTKTKFPKKIFVSPEVNAMVFYNSSFWSLFFPVRKNLEIGLGLVNTLTISEFKAVLAHEFGHFSQRSMKIGSYIYTVNRVIYNLVYEYDYWDEWLSKWAQTGGPFGFFAGITFWMVERVRGLLKIAYDLINVNYMKLSREMEYHADLVAVSVSGNKAFKNALRKIEFSSFAYDYTTAYLNTLATKKKASTNLYVDHQNTLSFLAKHNKISNENGNFQITDQDLENSVIKSRIHIKDQWASHPTLQEREKNISKVDVKCLENTDSAWTLFPDAAHLQTLVTTNLYSIGFPGSSLDKLTNVEFEAFIASEINKYKISESYNGFYDDRYLTVFDPKELSNTETTINSFSELYSKQTVEVIKRHISNKNDLQILGQISLKMIPTKHFEFDGKKYKRKEASKLIKLLKEEIKKEEQSIEQLDKASFMLNYRAAKQLGLDGQLLDHYHNYFLILAELKVLESISVKFQNFANHLYSQTKWTEDKIRQIAAELSNMEKEFKDFLKRQDIESIIKEIETESQKDVIREYVKSDNYFSKTYEFDEQSFINLYNLMNDVYGSFGITYGHALKKLTDLQLAFQQKTVSS